LGDVGVFAFYPNKQITTGEGGMLVTNDADVAASARSLRNQGRHDPDDWFQHMEVGYNYRISEINCALGLEQMKRIDAILARRAQVAAQYHSLLRADSRLILSPLSLPAARISWFVYVVRLSKQFGQTDRDRIMQDLGASGIATGRYFAPIHLQPCYSAYRSSNLHLPVTESESARSIALPFYNRLTDAQVERVCERLFASLDARASCAGA
jgi:perosamine synthetase